MSEMLQILFQYFSSREIAIGVWVLIALGVALLKRDVRFAFIRVIKATVNARLLLLFGSLAIYVGIVCWLLSIAGLWGFEQIGATAIWFLLSGAVMAARAINARENDKYFRNIIRDSVTVTVVFEFVVVAYSFSLLGELIFVPFATMYGAMLAVAESKPEMRPAAVFLRFIGLVIVAVLSWLSLAEIYNAPEAFFSAQTARNFILPIMLAIGSLPIFYFWYCAAAIENAFLGLRIDISHSEELKRYARWNFFWAFAWHPTLLRRALRQFRCEPAASKADVRRIIDDIRLYERRAKAPPPVDPRDGWSPFLARDFLSTEGLRTSDYHAMYPPGTYWAQSDVVDLDQELLPNRVTFTIEGDAEVVATLRLKGVFIKPATPESGLRRLHELGVALTAVALGISKEAALPLLHPRLNSDASHGHFRIRAWREDYPTGNGFEQAIELSTLRSNREPL